MQSVLRGIPASPGIVVGPVHLLRWEVPEVKHRLIDDGAIDAEIVRLHDAFERARDRLRHLRNYGSKQKYVNRKVLSGSAASPGPACRLSP